MLGVLVKVAFPRVQGLRASQIRTQSTFDEASSAPFIKVVGLVMTTSHFVVDVTLLLVVAFKKPTGARKGDQSPTCSVFTTTTFCHTCVRMRWRQLTGCTERSHMLTTAGFHFQCISTQNDPCEQPSSRVRSVRS